MADRALSPGTPATPVTKSGPRLEFGSADTEFGFEDTEFGFEDTEFGSADTSKGSSPSSPTVRSLSVDNSASPLPGTQDRSGEYVSSRTPPLRRRGSL